MSKRFDMSEFILNTEAARKGAKWAEENEMAWSTLIGAVLNYIGGGTEKNLDQVIEGMRLMRPACEMDAHVDGMLEDRMKSYLDVLWARRDKGSN